MNKIFKKFLWKIFIFFTFSKMSKKSEILPILLEWIYCKISIIFPNQKHHKNVRKNFRLHHKKIKFRENKKQIQIKPKFLTFFDDEILQ